MKIKATILALIAAATMTTATACNSDTPAPVETPEASDVRLPRPGVLTQETVAGAPSESMNQAIAPNGVSYPEGWGTTGAESNPEGRGSGIPVDNNLDEPWLAHTGGKPYILEERLKESGYDLGSSLRIIADDNLNASTFCSIGGVKLRNGQYSLMTAGHCMQNREGDISKYKIYNGDGSVYIGQFSNSEFDNDRTVDYARIPISTDMVPEVMRLKGHGNAQLTLGKVADLMPGMTICKIGGSTGETCGPVLNLSETGVTANLLSAAGDSGGVVYYMVGNTAHIIGMVSAVSDGNTQRVDGHYKTGSLTFVTLASNWGEVM